jgi:hypothetical protein
MQLPGGLPEVERTAQHERGVDVAHGEIDLHGLSPGVIDLIGRSFY